MSRLRRRILGVAVLLLVGGACLPLVARIVLGPPGGVVHVRWVGGLDASTRRSLEARFRLADGEPLEGTTWRYDLVDTSTRNIRQLVEAPEVDDTQHVDRTRFALSESAGTSRRTRIASGSALLTLVERTSLVSLGLSGLLLVACFAPRGTLRLDGSTLPLALLGSVVLVVHGRALWFPPVEPDDVAYLSSVASIENPLRYFVQDHGHGNFLYRPLTPVSLWLTYQLFGVWAFPNQLINLCLHLANVWLVFRIVRRSQGDQVYALLAAALFAVSPYTYTGAVWVSDRPMLVAGFGLLLLLENFSRHFESPRSPAAARPLPGLAAMGGLTLLALLSKESGVVLPIVVLLFALMPADVTNVPRRWRFRAFVAMGVSLLAYVGYRRLLFGANLAAYSQDGFMFLGLIHYADSDQLSPWLRYANFGENVVKHAASVVLPIVGDRGAIVSWEWFALSWPVALSTVLLSCLTGTRRPSPIQRLALFTLVASAVTHFALYRFRLVYLAHAAYCVYIGSLAAGDDGDEHRDRLAACRGLALTALAGSIVVVNVLVGQQASDRDRARDDVHDQARQQGRLAREAVSYDP